MGTIDLPQNLSGPGGEKPGSDASFGLPFHGSPSDNVQSRADIRQVTTRVLEEKTDWVLRRLESALATLPAAMSGGDTPLTRTEKKGLREKLYAYIERNYRALLDGLPHDDGGRIRRTRKEAGSLLESMGGVDRFNTGEIEKAAPGPVAQWEHPEAHANGMLTGRDGSAAFVNGENACDVLSCVFKDNACRPKTVTDVKLFLNIPEADLFPPVVRAKATALYLIGKIVCGHLLKGMDAEIAAVAEGNTAGDSSAGELARRILERCTEKAVPAPDPQDMAEEDMLKSARRCAFDGAVGLFVSALADNGLSYQFMEKLAHEDGSVEDGSTLGGDICIREYEDTDPAALPDERFAVRIGYFDRARLDLERGAYDAAVESFDAGLGHFRDLLEVIYRDSKSVFRVNDFDDLARKNRNRARETPGAQAGGKGGTCDRLQGRAGLAQIRERMYTVRDYLNPAERRIAEERLAFLEKEQSRIECMTNPHRLRPGILLDVELSFVKRKKTTLNSMSGVLDEFQRDLPGCAL